MSDIRVAIDNPDSPTWLPPPSAIIARCREVGLIVPGFVEHSPDGSESVWIKQGILIAMGEARTQKFLADVVNSDENCVVRVPQVYRAFRDEERGYIVMEYIPGVTVMDYLKGAPEEEATIVKAVANVLARMFAIPAPPDQKPSPVDGRGRVHHPFFRDWTAPVEYPSVLSLQCHLNAVS